MDHETMWNRLKATLIKVHCDAAHDAQESLKSGDFSAVKADMERIEGANDALSAMRAIEEEACGEREALLMVEGCANERTGQYACLALDGAFLRLYEKMAEGGGIDQVSCILYPMGQAGAALSDLEWLRGEMGGEWMKPGVVYAFPALEAHETISGHLLFTYCGAGPELASMRATHARMPDWRAEPWVR